MTDSRTCRPFKPLVVGAPRTGFSLLNSVLIYFTFAFPRKWDLDLRQNVLNVFVVHFGELLSSAIAKPFADAGMEADLLYNGNFRELCGGPKWLKADDPERACFRKYVGVRGLGDFSLITSHPRQVMDVYEIMHSHTAPSLWASHPGYADYVRYASVRNPVDTINSACHSINAIASEYLQKFCPGAADSVAMREPIALGKLTDMKLLAGMANHYKDYWTEYLAVRDQFIEMKWEDLIAAPTATIMHLAAAGGIQVKESFADSIWRTIGNQNLTGHHKHNFRHGRGRRDDWKNYLVNEHLEMFRDAGLGEFTRALGYGDIEFLDERNYTPFQQRVKTFIARGDKFTGYSDKDLYKFSYQKSNVRLQDLEGFRHHEWREWTKIERSCFADEDLERKVWDSAESVAGRLNAFFMDLWTRSFGRQADGLAALEDLRRKYLKDIASLQPDLYERTFDLARSVVAGYFAPLELTLDIAPGCA